MAKRAVKNKKVEKKEEIVMVSVPLNELLAIQNKLQKMPIEVGVEPFMLMSKILNSANEQQIKAKAEAKEDTEES